MLVSVYAISGIVAQLIKNFGFPNEPRPSQYFIKSMQFIHTVDGVELLKWHSFPSGHTTSAFAVFGLLAFLTKNHYLQALLFVIAAIVGFSRMYLFQHFMVDVWAGAILGTATAWLISRYVVDSAKIKY